MSYTVLTDSKVTFNSVNLSTWLISHDLPRSAETQDQTTMGDTTREFKVGLLNHTLTLEFIQDYGASGPDVTINAVIGAGIAAFPVYIKSTSAANSATNPEYQGNYVVESYDAMSGKLGELQKCKVVLKPQGPLSRVIA